MEKRKNIRIPFNIESIISYGDIKIKGKVLNICLQGMFIDIPQRIPLYTMVSVELLLEGDHIKKDLTLKSRVVRSGSNGTAVKLSSFNLDSYITLTNLMMDNVKDQETVMNEFCDLIEKNKII